MKIAVGDLNMPKACPYNNNYQQYKTKTMNETKKQYVKPDMTVMEVKLEPILGGSAYPTGDGWGDWFD